jgi:hypothetical protein
MLILKENAVASVPTPPVGKDTFFIDDSGTPSVKNSSGVTTTFPTTAASNAQVLFMNGSAITGDAQFTYNYNTDVLTVTGNVAATRVLTDNLLYANGTAWDLQQAAGSNTQIQFNNNNDFGASSNFTFNSATNVLTVTGNISAGNVSATDVTATTVGGTLKTAAQPNITSVGTLTSLAVSGNVTSGNVYANAGTVGALLLGGTLTTASQPNVTSLGTLTSLTVTGNGSFGNVSGGNLVQANFVGGTLTTAAQPNITSVGTLTSLGVTGNVTAGNLLGPHANGNSNVNIPASAGNVNISVNGTANVLVVTATGANIAGTLNATGNANVGNIGTAQVLATANVTAPQLIANVANGTSPLLVNSQTLVANLNADLLDGYSTATAATANTVVIRDSNGSFSANIITGTLTGAATTAGTVTTAAQPNITSVGTLTSLAVSGNATAGNVYANSGTIGASLLTGTLTTAAQPNVTSLGTLTSLAVTGNITAGNLVAPLANGNSSVTIPAAAGNVNVSVNGTANVLVVTATGANITGTLSTGTGVISGNGSGLTALAGGNVTGQVANALVAGTVYTAAQPNITSVGTLTSLGVSGAVTASTLTSNVATGTAPLTVTSTTRVANLNVAYANVADFDAITTVSTGNYYLTMANALTGNVATSANAVFVANAANGAITATTFVGALSGAATTAGTVTTAAQPNITSVGTLTSLAVTGNVDAGNLRTSGVLAVSGTGQSSIAGNLTMTSKNIINLADPVNAQDAATKNYVDLAVQGLHVHDSCYVGTTGTLATASGGTVSYNNGSSGVGATLTTTGTYLLIDGANVQTAGTRILVKNESNAAWNGIYTYTNTTTLTRATDFDTTAEAAGGDFVFITSGSTQADTGWVQTTDNPTIGTSNIVWTQFSGAGTYTAGTGLTLNGTQFSISNTAVTAASYGNGDRVASFTVNAQGQLTAASNVVIAANAANLTGTTLNSSIVTSSLTSVGTVTTGVWNNNIGSSATFAAGLSGANLASITGANVTGTVSSATTAGTVTTAAQPNITSVGTLSSLTVSGNITAQSSINLTSYMVQSVATGISAAGSTQGTATALTKDINVVATVTAGQGVVLPTAVAGMRIAIINTSAAALLVYPASGGAINALAANASYSLAAGARLDYVATTTTQWYTMNSTYA